MVERLGWIGFGEASSCITKGLNERAMHPRIATAIGALKDARAYMEAAPYDFGGHKAEAIRATDAAIHQLNFALASRGKEDRR